MSLAIAINEFFADRNVQSAIDASRECRPLQICYPKEIPMSRFLAWILDPTQGHGLNGAALRSLLTACWKGSTESGMDVTTRRRIAPGRVSTQSFADAIIQREVKLDDGKGRLDVLILLPQQGLLVAIENKFGASLGNQQLARYRKALAKRFPEWKHVLVMLDFFEGTPDDEGWIGLDYQWLSEELRVAEQSNWLGETQRSAMRQFLCIIDVNSPATLPGTEEKRLRSIVREHALVFEQMAAWNHAGESVADLATGIYARSATDEDRALQQLFPVYRQRIDLWRRCIPMLAHAGLQEIAEQRFEDLEIDPKRSAFYFSLTRWNRYQDEDEVYWPLQVMVRLEFDENDEPKRYIVASHVNLDMVADQYRATLAQLAQTMRDKHMKRKRVLDEDQGMVTLRVQYLNSQDDAAAALSQQLQDLETTLARVTSQS